jgi:hypothetical protein
LNIAEQIILKPKKIYPAIRIMNVALGKMAIVQVMEQENNQELAKINTEALIQIRDQPMMLLADVLRRKFQDLARTQLTENLLSLTIFHTVLKNQLNKEMTQAVAVEAARPVNILLGKTVNVMPME